MDKKTLELWMNATDMQINALSKCDEAQMSAIKLQKEQINLLSEMNKLLNERIDNLVELVKEIGEIE